MRMLVILTALALTVATVATAQNVAVSGGGNLASLAKSKALVTVVLKNGNLKDPNLRITSVYPDHFRAIAQNGQTVAYKYDAVQSVQVQNEVVDKKEFALPKEMGLNAKDQAIVDTAMNRARQLFQGDNQDIKMPVAMFLAAYGEREALQYLKSLSESNDPVTQSDASVALFCAGETVAPDVIRSGLKSGNRRVRAQAARLAGETGLSDPALGPMLHDRIAELAIPAARALARLGDRGIIPALQEMLDSSSADRAEAAVFALTKLAGPDVTEQMKTILNQASATDSLKWRAARVLFALDAPEGKDFVQKMLRESPTMGLEAALLLAPGGEWSAVEYLYGRLQRREDPSDCNQYQRARIATTLIRGGDLSAIVTLQSLLRENSVALVQAVCGLVADTGDRRYIAILEPNVQSQNTLISANACIAIGILGKREFHDRIVQVHEDDDFKDPCSY